MFGLAIYISIEGSWEPPFNAKEVVKQWLEFWGEQWAFIQYNWIRKAMMPNYYV